MNTAEQTPKKIGIGMIITAWIILFGLLAMFFDDWLDNQHNPNQQPVTTVNGPSREVVLQPNRQHHYIVNGQINDKAVVFLLDTGATDVVVPAALADRLGLQRGAKQYATTANGTIAVFTAMLERITIGSIELHNIRASINPGMNKDVVLLGMSALREIEFSQRGDTLILRQ